MEDAAQKTFHCTLIDPTGKLLDCQTTSLVFPAHDGQIGILYNHMPMLCQLGLGIMRVDVVSADKYRGPSQTQAQFFVDRGFALVAANSAMIIAYDAFALQDVKRARIEAMIERTARDLPTAALSADQRVHENERLRVLRRISESIAPE
jgi:F-type H+-transporting ATPase subunit epsilon